MAEDIDHPGFFRRQCRRVGMFRGRPTSILNNKPFPPESQYEWRDGRVSLKRCMWPLPHRDKHNCGCVCVLRNGHTGRHHCTADARIILHGEIAR